jgi:hypothetical protein
VVILKLSVAKIRKYGMLIRLLRSDEESQSECGKMLLFAIVASTSELCWPVIVVSAPRCNHIVGNFNRHVLQGERYGFYRTT